MRVRIIIILILIHCSIGLDGPILTPNDKNPLDEVPVVFWRTARKKRDGYFQLRGTCFDNAWYQ